LSSVPWKFFFPPVLFFWTLPSPPGALQLRSGLKCFLASGRNVRFFFYVVVRGSQFIFQLNLFASCLVFQYPAFLVESTRALRSLWAATRLVFPFAFFFFVMSGIAGPHPTEARYWATYLPTVGPPTPPRLTTPLFPPFFSGVGGVLPPPDFDGPTTCGFWGQIIPSMQSLRPHFPPWALGILFFFSGGLSFPLYFFLPSPRSHHDFFNSTTTPLLATDF